MCFNSSSFCLAFFPLLRVLGFKKKSCSNKVKKCSEVVQREQKKRGEIMVPCVRKKDMWGTVGVVKLTRGKKRFSEGSAKCSRHALRVAKLVLYSLPLSLLPVSCVL